MIRPDAKLHIRRGVVFGLAALALAAQLLVTFLAEPRSRWVGLLHDRNGHYVYGLKMAVALERADLVQFIGELEKGKVWPPLHGLLVTGTQLLSGNDWRMAVLPSLAGWVLMLVAVSWAAARITDSRGGPWAAGAIAFVFAALSPAHRIFATDIMLESLGAGLSVAILACYAAAAEQRASSGWWRATSLGLTLLFFEKYNYWLIIAFALATVETWSHRQWLRDWLTKIEWRKRWQTELRQPLNWLFLILVAAITVLLVRGPTSFIVFGQSIAIRRPNNLITVAYAMLFLRVCLVLRRQNWKPQSVPGRMVWHWHILPLAISFLIPQRLAVFAGFLSPTNYGDVPTRDLAGGAMFYTQAFAGDCHVSTWFAAASVVLVGCALFGWPRLGLGGRAVLVCVILGAALTLLHPNQKSRFLHSWVPALWVAAGAGAGALGRTNALRLLLGGGIALAALAGGKSWASSGHSPETGNRGEGRSVLDLSDTWLAETSGSDRIAFVATQPARPFIEWTFLQRYGRRERFEWPRFQNEGTSEAVRVGLERWLEETSTKKLFFIEIPPISKEFAPMFDRADIRANFPDWMARHPRWSKRGTITLPENGVVTIWTAD